MAKRSGKAASYADVFRAVLALKGWNYYRAARASGLTAVAVADIYKGKRQPKAESLHRLLRAAGLPWGWLDQHFDPPLKLPDPP
jgi:transcriptional regulator with XRE-family HTH domain